MRRGMEQPVQSQEVNRRTGKKYTHRQRLGRVGWGKSNKPCGEGQRGQADGPGDCGLWTQHLTGTGNNFWGSREIAPEKK